jgi:hypothetical protein
MEDADKNCCPRVIQNLIQNYNLNIDANILKNMENIKLVII